MSDKSPNAYKAFQKQRKTQQKNNTSQKKRVKVNQTLLLSDRSLRQPYP